MAEDMTTEQFEKLMSDSIGGDEETFGKPPVEEEKSKHVKSHEVDETEYLFKEIYKSPLIKKQNMQVNPHPSLILAFRREKISRVYTREYYIKNKKIIDELERMIIL